MKNLKCAVVGTFLAVGLAGVASSAEFEAAHDAFRHAFNERDWATLKSVLAEDVVFHRAAAPEVHVGRDAVIGHLQAPIAGEWNVKFTKLDTSEHFTGKEGRVVERGDFAITAGATSDSCYRGSYLMTWASGPEGWKLQVLTWQDLETDVANC